MDQKTGDGQTKTEWIDAGVDELSIDLGRSGTETDKSVSDTDPARDRPTTGSGNDSSTTGPGNDSPITDSDNDSPTTDSGNSPSAGGLYELCTGVSVEPVYADGRLYTVSDGSLVALEEATGEQMWECVTEGVPTAAPAVSDHHVYWRTDRSLHAISREDGTGRWSVPATGTAQGPPVVDDGLVVTAARDGTVSIVTADYGRSVRSFRSPHRPSSLAMTDGALFISSLEGGITAYDATDGSERWRFAPDRAIHAPPVVGPDAVYVTAVDDGGVCALDRETGTPRWSHRVETSVWTSPKLVAGTVYVGDCSGSVSAVRANDGAERWRTEVPAEISSGPVVVEDTVYVGCDGGLYAFDRETGAIRRRFELTGRVAVVASSTSVFARDQRGSLFVLHPEQLS